FEKYFVPVFSAVIGLYQLLIGLYLLNAVWGQDEVELERSLLCGICMTAIAFGSFLISRYATGMSDQAQWKPLRAGGSALLGAAVLCFALAVVLSLEHLFDILKPLEVVSLLVPALLVLLGIETLLCWTYTVHGSRVNTAGVPSTAGSWVP
ncbi:MAG: hypothetical protein ACYTDV_18990, partial [Planctomycetota bacterium]